MAEEVAKQEINATRGTFEFRGIISNLDKNQDVDSTTKKGNAMRSLVFNIDTAEGHSHRLQLRAYQSEKVYFSKTEVDKDGNRKNDVKEVKWNDRLKFNKEGYQPIDRVRFHNGMKTDDNGKEIRNNVSMLTFDAIPEILKEFNVGDSVRITGNIQIEDYTMQNGNSGTAVRLIPTTIYHTSDVIDFTKEDFSEVANFTQRILVDEVEKTGSDEVVVTGIVIGNQRMGRQDFIFRETALQKYVNLLKVMKSAKKYVAMTVKGILNNGAAKEEATEEFVEVMGVKVPVVQARPTANSFVREFLVTDIVTGDSGDAIDNGIEYTEENVQQFIDQFIRARQEFGESTNTAKVEETTSDADDFAF